MDIFGLSIIVTLPSLKVSATQVTLVSRLG
jgi:hypothetical protein